MITKMLVCLVGFEFMLKAVPVFAANREGYYDLGIEVIRHAHVKHYLFAEECVPFLVGSW
jgi:hypothetical protein